MRVLLLCVVILSNNVFFFNYQLEFYFFVGPVVRGGASLGQQCQRSHALCYSSISDKGIIIIIIRKIK